MPRLLILLTLPKDVRDFYATRLGQRFPQLQIDVVDHHSKAAPFMPAAEVLISFGPMMKDEVLRDSQSEPVRNAASGISARSSGSL